MSRDENNHEAPANGSDDQQQPIIARPSRAYRWRRYILVGLVLGAAAYFAYDGWIGWPESNRQLAQITADLEAARAAGDEQRVAELSRAQRNYTFRTDTDIFIQKLLAFSLPALGLLMLGWFMYNSRGVYRLDGQTLEAPGHPPVRLEQITRLDRSQWDRKGIAFVEYAPADGGPPGRIRLDDFIYEQGPTDRIFERIEACVTAQGGAVEESPRMKQGTEA